MPYTMTVSKTVTPIVDGSNSPGVQITFTVTAVTGFSDMGLFLKQNGVSKAVCRPAELAAYNMATPTPPTNFVRAVNFSYFQANTQAALATAELIQADLAQLISDMTLLDQVGTSTTINLP